MPSCSALEGETVSTRLAGHSACNGILDDVHEYDRPSVRFQQVLSFAWRGVSRDSKPLTMKNLAKRTGDQNHEFVVNDMLKTGALENQRGALIPSTELMDQGEKRLIHTTISGSANITMVDGTSGETLIATSGQNISAGALYVGGKIKQVVSRMDGTVTLEKARTGQPLSTLPATRGRRGMSRRIVWALAETGGYDPRYWSFEGNRLTTWGGSDYNQLLAIILKRYGVAKNISADEYCIIGKDALKFCDRTRFFRYLSNDMQAEEAFRSIPFDGFLNWLQECNTLPEDKESTVSETEIQRQKKKQVDNSKNGFTLQINWREDNQAHPGIQYARAVTSHLYSAAGRVSGKTTNTPLIEDLDLQDCAFLLREKSEITLTFHKSDTENCLAEDWVLRIDGGADNQVKINISDIQTLGDSIDFFDFGNFQWLQAEPDLTSPIGVLALTRNQSKLHSQAFHTLVGLARFFGEPVKAELTVVQNKPKPIITWQSDPPDQDTQTTMPVYSHLNGSLWLPGLYEKEAV